MQLQSISDFFVGLNQSHLDILGDYMVVLTAPKGVNVVAANSRPTWWGVLCKGDLLLYAANKTLVRQV